MDENLDVVELGDLAHERDDLPARGWRHHAADPRAAVALLVLGGATAAASLFGEWQIAATPAEPLESSFSGIGSVVNDVWSSGVGDTYLVALTLLGALVAVVLAAPVTARGAARAAGLGLSAVLLVLLGAAAHKMSAPSGVPQLGLFFSPEGTEKITVTLARGLWAALATPVLLGLAFLSMHLRGTLEQPEQAAANPSAAFAEPEPGEIELTVSTAAPFVRQY
ncbi:hypothetical protein Cs7R123_40790 [Catellatospora sp. TT07R-123]|uniref:hypothetical protein n=1 Tax=Catellatospora sp. TT07R-123 TaxID=2733863 RepID=UPI001B086015|nr:hypothetical protein [Catellatospora sp. TT07R-123]GHJ46737.1 hypothetical protein Cs7R123_40790 [Catellatospora sp. TT07R-123]